MVAAMAEPNNSIDPRLYSALVALSTSPIIQKPRQTIAWGILTALFYYTLCAIVFGLVIGLMLGIRSE